MSEIPPRGTPGYEMRDEILRLWWNEVNPDYPIPAPTEPQDGK